jgi:2-isopropylmalate synthase
VQSIPAPQNLVSEELVTAAGAKTFSIRADVQFQGVGHHVTGVGTGPIDAFVAGLNSATGHAVRVLDYHEHAIGAGAAAQAVAYLELRINGQTLFGVGMDSNIVSASLKAIVSGLQRIRAPQACAVNMAD